MSAEELSALQQNLPQKSLAFGFSDQVKHQVVMGYLISYATRSEQAAFDEMMPEMLDLFATAYGATTEPEMISGLDDLGETRVASTFVSSGGEINLRWENVLFRRNEIGVFLFLLYPDGEEPAVPAGVLTHLLDQRIIQSLGIASCIRPQPHKLGQELSGKIAFVSDRDGNPEIYTINADGSGETRLTNNPANDYAPAWSPDGERIAFYSERDGNAEIYVMNADGTGQTNLTNNPAADYAPAWSPDGKRIAFHSHRFQGAGRIFVMNADGSGVRRLTDPSFDDWSPAWSPDGSQIVFNSSRGESGDIWIMQADGSHLVNITKHPADDWWPDWSPDGQRIAFHSTRDDNFEIYAINLDGSGTTRLTDHPASDYDPVWSSDGSHIAFTSDRCENRDIWLVNADGSEVSILTSNPANDWAPAWSGPRTAISPPSISAAAPASTWRDEFDAALSEPWNWTNENPEKWNLVEQPGHLRIYASPYNHGEENMLLRPVGQGDFMIETHVFFKPIANFQFAGLIIYQDADNRLALGRAFCDLPKNCVENGIYFDNVQGDTMTETNFATAVDSDDEAYLRLERQGDRVTASYSSDGVTWSIIGTHWIPSSFQVNGVGLVASQDISKPDWDIPADFDFFELAEYK